MTITFIVAAVIAFAATLMVITRTNAVHALLYLIVSLLAVAVDFYVLGAPFAAALEVITYAGAIMVLFIFVVMMLNLGAEQEQIERRWLRPSMWGGPALLAGCLLAELVFVMWRGRMHGAAHSLQSPNAVGATLFGPWLIAVELAGMLLLAALVAAYHLGHRSAYGEPREEDSHAHRPR